MKMTLVRMIETKEPVMAMDQIDDLVFLGETVDMVVDPALCEYLDIDIEMPIQILYPGNMGWKTLDADEKADVFCSAEMGSDTATCLHEAFTRKRGWIAFPEGFDFLSRDRDCRIMQPEDLF